MDKRAEVMRLALLLPEGKGLFRQRQMAILRARMMGLGQGVYAGECLAGAWSVSDKDADELIRLARVEIEESFAAEMRSGRGWVQRLVPRKKHDDLMATAQGKSDGHGRECGCEYCRPLDGEWGKRRGEYESGGEGEALGARPKGSGC